MSEPLSHDRAVEELELVAVGAAPAEVTAGVLAHAKECVECRAELDELTVLVAALTSLIPEAVLNRGRSAGIRSRLMARANADAEAAAKRRVDAAARRKAQDAAAARMPAMQGWERMAKAATDERPPRQEMRETPVHPQPARAQPARESQPSGGRTILLLWAIIATVALLGSSTAALVLFNQRSSRDETTAAQIADLEERQDSLERALGESHRTIENLVGPTMRVIDLVNWLTGGRPIARVFWDTQSNRWSLFVYELRPPRAGHIYQLWALTAEGRISAGTFTPAANGTARTETTVTLNPESVRSLFITEEPVPGSRQPTARPIAGGAL